MRMILLMDAKIWMLSLIIMFAVHLICAKDTIFKMSSVSPEYSMVSIMQLCSEWCWWLNDAVHYGVHYATLLLSDAGDLMTQYTMVSIMQPCSEWCWWLNDIVHYGVHYATLLLSDAGDLMTQYTMVSIMQPCSEWCWWLNDIVHYGVHYATLLWVMLVTW